MNLQSLSTRSQTLYNLSVKCQWDGGNNDLSLRCSREGRGKVCWRVLHHPRAALLLPLCMQTSSTLHLLLSVNRQQQRWGKDDPCLRQQGWGKVGLSPQLRLGCSGEGRRKI